MTNWQDKYEKLEQIGEGSSGKIFKVAVRGSGQVLAAKVISGEGQGCELKAVEQEIKIMSGCSHLNIIRCLGVDIFPGEVWILLQYCQGRSLADIIKMRKSTFTEQEIASILKQVLEGLIYLHRRNIVHRDIKASNLLYHKGVVKVADFGISIIDHSLTESKFGRFGSPYWMSPEILANSIYNEKSDIWALGITAIELAEGEPPYSHQHPFRAIYSIQTHPPQALTKPENWSKAFNSFVKSCLNVDYKSRPTAQMLATHQFVAPHLDKGNRLESSPGCQSNESEDTIIMHQDIPKSIWEKQSYPQSTEKDKLDYSMTDTVIIKEFPNEEEESLRCEEPNQYFPKEPRKDGQEKGKELTLQAREKLAKDLFLKMEEEIKQVRRRYMGQIKALYTPSQAKQNKNQENKTWNSPVKKLKEKNREVGIKQHSKATSDMPKMLY